MNWMSIQGRSQGSRRGTRLPSLNPNVFDFLSFYWKNTQKSRTLLKSLFFRIPIKKNRGLMSAWGYKYDWESWNLNRIPAKTWICVSFFPAVWEMCRFCEYSFIRLVSTEQTSNEMQQVASIFVFSCVSHLSYFLSSFSLSYSLMKSRGLTMLVCLFTKDFVVYSSKFMRFHHS